MSGRCARPRGPTTSGITTRPARAAARVDALAGQGIPAYTVEIATTSGQARHRVYAGAYEAMTQAEVMGELLKRAGIEAPLIRRTGRSVE